MPNQAPRGRPAGLLLNPAALRHLLGDRTQLWLAGQADMSTAQLSGMIAGTKGATQAKVEAIAAALGCEPGVLFPELVQFHTTIRHFTAPKVDEVAA
jgi:hypothetical protein